MNKRKFEIEDCVQWSVNGELRTGVVIEIVPAGSSPQNKIYRKTVTAVRDHESYVVKAQSNIVWPQAWGLTLTERVRKVMSKKTSVAGLNTQVAAKEVAQARLSKKVDASDYIKSLEDAVIALSKSYLFNRDLFKTGSGRGVLFEEVGNDFALEPLYELTANKSIDVGLVKGILESRNAG